MNAPSMLRVRVRSITRLAPQVHAVVLETLDGRALPPAEPGCHIDLRLGPQLLRSYSVVGRAGADSRYEIAVARDAASRGGSVHVHDRLRVGDELEISAPRNLFPLLEDAPASLLIAGGIGITPIWSMVQRLEALGRPWQLLYAARSRRDAAYLDEVEACAAASAQGQLCLHFDDERGTPPDLAQAVAAAPADAHLYCCGPQPMLAAYERATAGRPAAQVHLERFAAPQSTVESGAFTLLLARSGLQFEVPPDRSILDVMLEQGLNAQYGCMQGACGLCETAVVDGIPEHRDTLLSDEDRASNRKLLICCSRSRTPTLTLDA